MPKITVHYVNPTVSDVHLLPLMTVPDVDKMKVSPTSMDQENVFLQTYLSLSMTKKMKPLMQTSTVPPDINYFYPATKPQPVLLTPITKEIKSQPVNVLMDITLTMKKNNAKNAPKNSPMPPTTVPLAPSEEKSDPKFTDVTAVSKNISQWVQSANAATILGTGTNQKKNALHVVTDVTNVTEAKPKIVLPVYQVPISSTEKDQVNVPEPLLT